jgi:excisionase family DNA binding protein
MTADGLLGVGETARRLGVHPNTVRNWVKAGIIMPEARSPRPGGRYLRFTEAEVNQVLAVMRQHDEDRLAGGDVKVGVLVVIRTPPGMTPEEAVREIAKGIRFGHPEVRLHYVLPPASAVEQEE